MNSSITAPRHSGGDDRPQARTEKLIVRQLAGETLVYDEAGHKALCLNETAAFLWQRCDGETSTAALARELGHRFGTTVDVEVVRHGLAQLSKQGLLREHVRASRTDRAAMSRRTMLRRAGVAAAISLPLVTSIIAPTAAQAATLGGTGASCTDGSQCTSTVCNGGFCS